MKKTFLLTVFTICLIGLNASAQSSGKPVDTLTVFSIADSASFTGKYKYEGLPFDYMEITVKDNKLHFSGGQYDGNLVPVKDKKDVFDAGGVALFSFIRNSEKKVVGLQIDYQGQTFLGDREEK